MLKFNLYDSCLIIIIETFSYIIIFMSSIYNIPKIYNYRCIKTFNNFFINTKDNI